MAETNPQRVSEATLRDVVAFGVYLVLVAVAEPEDFAAVSSQAATFAGTAVVLADALLHALKDSSPGESA